MKKVKYEIDTFMGVTFALSLGGVPTGSITSFSHLKNYHALKHRKGGVDLYSNLYVWSNNAEVKDIYFTKQEIRDYIENSVVIYYALDEDDRDGFLGIVASKLLEMKSFKGKLFFTNRQLWVEETNNRHITFLLYMDL